ncbi:MAG: flagellar biosynthesis protein FliL [Rhodospirillaceae bacterium]|nr:flagellar biosynthesis protein FliL [Rhodospirillaceae bacterium]|tara:strand:+ start:609 stop:1190 length:582 start_codon:yes stop_codon:yes gene_type:complete
MADEENNEPKKKGAILRILIFVVAGLVLIGAGLGGGYILFGGSQPDPSDEIESIIEKKMAEADAERQAEEEAALNNEKVVKETPEIETFVTTYFEFPGDFTTNLRESRKFLQVGLGVSTQYDDEVISNVEDHQLALRSEILNVMSEFSEEDIQGKQGREALARALADGVNAKLMQLEDFGGIEEVHFTSFVLQ